MLLSELKMIYTDREEHKSYSVKNKVSFLSFSNLSEL